MDQPKTWAQDALMPPEPDGQFVMIPLTKGKFAIFDEADAELVLSRGPWIATAAGGSSRTWYALRQEGSPPKPLFMQWLIGGRKWLDHANRNGLDNRRINLRPATRSQNGANRAPDRRNTSGYKGVHWDRGASRWVAKIKSGGSQVRLGYFRDPAEAARAYNQAALEVFGEFAWLNPLPPESPAA